MNDKPQTISLESGGQIAYRKTAGKAPGVMFCGGYSSDMTGSKAVTLEEYCKSIGQAFIRFDYEGHGQSSGDFQEGTIGRWLDNALKVFDELTEGTQFVIGSSMGAWIMLHLALKRQERIAGLIGIASAPDFTHELILRDLNQEQRRILKEEGRIELPSGTEGKLLVTSMFVEEAAKHLLMSYDEIPLEVPVRLIHGMKDSDVPWTTSLRIAEKITGKDVRIILEKEGGHRMSEPQNLLLLKNTLSELVRL